jgi:2-dehydropantoate 2-reductase
VDYLQGAILRLAKQHGADAPLSARVLALVKQAEAARAGPPKLTPRQIRQR